MTATDTLTAARNGDTDALADLYVEHFPAAVLIAKRENAADPEDVAAQVLAEVCDRFGVDGNAMRIAYRQQVLADLNEQKGR